MKPLGEYEVWFLTGSQDLHGEERPRYGDRAHGHWVTGSGCS